MDFLEIRRKAREQAAAREGAKDPAPGAEAAPPAPGAAPAAPGGERVITDADVLEGQLAARLQGLPAADDARFTTWRPGTGAPPAVPAPKPDDPAPRAEDFTVLSPLASGAGLAPPGRPPPARARPPDPLDEFFYRDDEEAPEVPSLADALAPALAFPAAGAREEYLTFVLGDEEYAVAIQRVREVMKAPPITEVPRAPPHVLGVVTVRGVVVTVFDPRRRLALPGAAPAPGEGRVVIVDAGEGPCGLLVDAVASVVRLAPGSIEPRPQGLGGASAECIAGIGRDGERLFSVLDLAAFLRRPAAGPRRAEEGPRDGAP